MAWFMHGTAVEVSMRLFGQICKGNYAFGCQRSNVYTSSLLALFPSLSKSSLACPEKS